MSGASRVAARSSPRSLRAVGSRTGIRSQSAAAASPRAGRRVGVDGKFFARSGQRFQFRGVTYGTFAPREADGERFCALPQVRRDFAAMRTAGFTVVRTYTAPPEDVLQAADAAGLLVMADAFFPDWRYLVGCSRRDQRRLLRDARAIVRRTAARFAGDERMLAISLGNEVPADVLRWLGTDVVAGAIRQLAEDVRDEDPELLVTYSNYPTAEYLPLETLDFLTFNVYLERRDELRRYVTRLQQLAGDRPLVLGEIGSDAGAHDDGAAQAESLDWQLETAVERGVAGTCVFSWTDEWHVGDARVEGWQFGLVRDDRSPRAALEVVQTWNARTVRDLPVRWPGMSVVICAYNAEATIDECLRHTCALDYPSLEVIVVDDGSTDATAEIVSHHPRARLVQIDHAGLSAARNEGFRAAGGELIAYLDSDAYPSPEWPYFLALGLDGRNVGGVGGPNLPPADDPFGADVVARAPGGPVHVLVADDRAEHVPGCNMAFWKKVLEEVGGFDPIYTSAGDDVDLCWRVLDRRWEIGFHPAAVVWHHRRPGLRPYLRQQRGYGRSEALVEARHPDRFTAAGTARWRGRIYNSLTPSVRRQRVYRGVYGTAAYQSVYRSGGHVLDLLHQLGVPVAIAYLLAAPLALVSPLFGAPALAACVLLLTLFLVDVVRATPPATLRSRRRRFRVQVAVHHLLQPLVRTWGRSRSRRPAQRRLSARDPLPAPLASPGRGVLLYAQDRPRAAFTAAAVDQLRRTGLRVIPATGWERYDARVVASSLVFGDLQTSAYPEGYVQCRLRTRVCPRRTCAAAAIAFVGVFLEPVVAGGLLAAGTLDVLAGWARLRLAVFPRFRRAPADTKDPVMELAV